MKSVTVQVQLISNLQQFAERAFVLKLKKKNPSISQKEIVAELNRWYKIRPGAEHGDGAGRIGDPSRFR